MSEIESVLAREILDAGGNPTVEVEVNARTGTGRASAPGGRAEGAHAARELRDGDPARYRGRGVLGAVRAVETVLGPAILGMDALDQAGIDRVLRDADGTARKSKLGSNAILALSMAVARAAADSVELPLWRYLGGANARVLPTPLVVVTGAPPANEGGLELVQVMVVPHGVASWAEALRAVEEIVLALAEQPQSPRSGGASLPSLEGDAATDRVIRAIEAAGYRPGEDVGIAFRAGLDNLYDAEQGRYALVQDRREALVSSWKDWCRRAPVVSIEDGCAAADSEGWMELTSALGQEVQLPGSSVFCGDAARLADGIDRRIANAVVLAPSQIGTVTETLDCIRIAQEAGYRVIVSHAAGETDDALLADLAVATNAGQLKTSVQPGANRTAAYNQLTRIAWSLGEEQLYAGRRPYRRR